MSFVPTIDFRLREGCVVSSPKKLTRLKEATEE